MTEPRRVEPGQSLFITRRSVCRFYLFRPDTEMNDGFLYSLAVAAEEHGVVLHAECLLSTHHHLVATDVRGVHPDFTRRFHRLVANFTKVLRGWPGEVWNGSGPSVVVLLTPEAILDKIGYTLANPVAAGAVRNAWEWPGLTTRVDDMGRRTITVKRPKKYFDPDGEKLPDEVELRFELPARLLELHGEAETRRLLRESLHRHEELAREEVREKGWVYLGADRVRKLSPYKRAKAYEVFGSRNPTFATKGGGREAFFAEVERLREFRAGHRWALERWRAGDRDVIFPAGTWRMRVLHGVRCAPWPAAELAA